MLLEEFVNVTARVVIGAYHEIDIFDVLEARINCSDLTDVIRRVDSNSSDSTIHE